MLHNVHYSSETAEWWTPDEVFLPLHREFKFTLDVAATGANARVDRYYTKESNGLKRSWAGETCWCNPPYGSVIKLWTRKAAQCAETTTTVLIIPARTETLWWSNLVLAAKEVRFITGRVNFLHHVTGAGVGCPFPSAIVVVGPGKKKLDVGWWKIDAGAITRYV